MVLVGTKQVPTRDKWTLLLRDGGVGPWRSSAKLLRGFRRGNSSVAQLAQKYAVNANQIFKWRKDYREERLKNSPSIDLLPVIVAQEALVPAAKLRNPSCQAPAGTLQIELPRGNLRIGGSVELGGLANGAEDLAGMIGMPSGTRIWIVAGVTHSGVDSRA